MIPLLEERSRQKSLWVLNDLQENHFANTKLDHVIVTKIYIVNKMLGTVHMYFEHNNELELETAHQKKCCVLVNSGGQKEKLLQYLEMSCTTVHTMGWNIFWSIILIFMHLKVEDM